jgi:hypothetical protein
MQSPRNAKLVQYQIGQEDFGQCKAPKVNQKAEIPPKFLKPAERY